MIRLKNEQINKVKIAVIVTTALFMLFCIWAFADTAKAKVTDEYLDHAENYAGIKWAVKLGTGWENNPTQPVVHGSYLYVATKTKVLKINKETGATVKKVAIPSGQTFNIIPITYIEKSDQGVYGEANSDAGDILLVPMAENQVRGLDADTLETLFTTEKDSKAASGYQITTNIVSDGEGYYYFGTWYGDVQKGYYYCYRIGQETPVWRVEHTGGFYLANAFISDKYVYFTSENGLRSQDDGTSTVLYTCMKGADYESYDIEPETPVIDTDPVMAGNARAAVVSDGEALYTVTQAGCAYKFNIGESGLPELDTTAGNGGKVELPGASTGEATIYNGVIYYCCADGTINSYSTEDLSQISSIKGYGYTQNGIELSNAKESEEGLYIYGTYNKVPGGIFAAKATAAGKLSDMIQLFTPPEDLRQYNMTGIVMDGGRIYYRNDSGYLMALEPGYTIWTQAASGGTVTKGLSAEAGSTHTFAITPNQGYKCVDVIVDGAAKGGKADYTFENVSAPHEMKAMFMQTAAPGIKAVSQSRYDRLTVKWKSAKGATGYALYRSKALNGSYSRIAVTTGLSYIDKGRVTGRKYYYKVRGLYKNGSIGADNTICTALSSAEAGKTALAKPSVTVKAKKGRKALVKWKKVAGATGYKIYRAVKRAGKYKLVKTIKKGTILKWTNNNLKKGRKYYYKIKAYRKSGGNTAYSAFSTIKYCKARK